MVSNLVSSRNQRPSKAASFNEQISHRSSNAIRVEAKTKHSQHHSYLKQLEEEIKLLTSYASDTIYRLNYGNMKYDYISPTIKNLLGFSPDEMKKINFRELILETRIVTNGLKTADSFDDLEIIRKQGDVNQWQADYLMRTKDGRQVWISDVSSPWFDDNGKIIGSVGSMRDITLRIDAQEKMKQDLQKIANTDALTGLCNRQEFFDSLDRELKLITRNQGNASILLIDIDNFYNLQNTYGQAVSDQILIEVTNIIKSCLRETDILSRISGAEFGALLPDTDLQGSFHVAERIRNSVLKSSICIGVDDSISCSISAGISSASPREEKVASDMFKEADTRLYIAKNTGSNQVSADKIMHIH